MNCKSCGAPLRPNAKFCGVCGTPVGGADTAPKQEAYRPGGQTAKEESYRSEGRAEQPTKREAYIPGGQMPKEESYRSEGRAAKEESYRPGGRAAKEESYRLEGRAEQPVKQKPYRPEGRTEQPEKREAYRPSGRKPSTAGADMEVSSSDRKAIRKYFLAQRILPIVLICIGIPTVFIGIGFVFIIVGIVLMFRTSFSGEDAVDRAVDRQIKVMKKRGMKKLNLIQDEVSLIDPVVLIGIGESPDKSFNEAREAAGSNKKHRSIFSVFNIFNIFRLFSKKKSNGTENDPVEALRIGSDDCLRSLLLEITVFLFTEQQVLMYRGDVDISTGLVYTEMTAECFYQDIEGMNFAQSVYKVFAPKKKKYMNKIMESFTLYMGGCKFSASMNTEMNNSMVDNQFAAMRSLIRDKKNA